MKKIIASDLMCRKITSVPPDMALSELAELLADEEIHGAPVVGLDGRLEGVVSRSDVIRALSEEFDSDLSAASSGIWNVALNQLRTDPTNDQRVRDVMTTRPVVAAPDASAGELAQRMMDEKVHRVLIVRGDNVLGLVSTTDLLQAVVDYEKVPAAKT